ncbi:histidinol dehydrogenase [Oceanobacillus alkalisoli]|uniref:histidinol dehydrogenase n=1 Tax=Oceanobacillus alkalisoli TaxID=2925113 RepID=UPI001EF034B8|nr:histidinol dehydrogenase [Oceanobacillus alkalisoli]MCF3944596.1 histidinol dehydrogenase [Oceanobacillus alkalisoli]MCG5104783.1 histidinol dehydrogenase [Oceanobacillus alkalisoli]
MKIITAEAFAKEWNDRTEIETIEAALDDTVLEIIRTVQEKKDAALYEYTEQFDGAALDGLLVREEEFSEAEKIAAPELVTALKEAAENIRNYHLEQKEKSWMISQEQGILLGQKVTPIERVGAYIPGGKAAYPSTVLMTIIPAQIAGVEEIAITTPVDKDGKVNPYVLLAAKLIGVEKIYKVGGAQAIAALAYGTETVKRVDKIVGPGNAYVARAKKWVYGTVGIDMIAGPSEICVIADEKANPRYVAADLLSQAEHDESASAICVTTNKEQAAAIQKEIAEQTEKLERKEIIQASIEANGRIIIAGDLEMAAEISNQIAPEHLELMVEHPMELLQKIKHAGAIFLGNYSPEPLGDYFAGPNHTLPTSGTARFASGLGVYDFVTRSTIISYPQEAFVAASEQIKQLANVEGLTAHANSIQVRKEDL